MLDHQESTQAAQSDTYSVIRTFRLPSAVSALAFGHAGHLFVGGDDGTLRIYDLSKFKVIKAVRDLGDEVASIVCVKRRGSELRDAWVACGTTIMKFQLDNPKMILTPEDMQIYIDIGGKPHDLLNEIVLNSNKTHLAVSTDLGTVAVVELETKNVMTMKVAHDSVCGCVQFIPTKSKELVSGGYDHRLLHFDYTKGDLLSERKIRTWVNPLGGMSLSPPFIMSMAMSPMGILAAGTADGRLRLNFVGAPTGSSRKTKDSKPWNGLDERREHIVKAAEGPIVAMAFFESETLTVSSLKGTIIQYKLVLEEDGLVLDVLWQKQVTEVERVNAIIVDKTRIIIGGIRADDSGAFEIWSTHIP
ncbi:hypothetical protein AMATHDRAFT_141950 [Amanita thiersii Skay4041]|uniref:Anaphase-promoting complex subunit 4 WD40 domain-containing protein n=1 Tax=Amanita thiersii Skay4041 TaxID=703135 RepID=A0A2A9NL69_9AGAR|nr:hypothetical protein AMATHDRAFT_141950 [Amanita thiersii Skay4041]